jgi:hypothetical protein
LESSTSLDDSTVQSLPHPSEDIPTCEISGLSDFEDDEEDDDDDLVRTTSWGSITPEETEAELSGSSSVSDLDRTSCSSSASMMDPEAQAQLLDSVNEAFNPDKHTEAPTTLNEPLVKLGEIVMHSKAMDVSIVQITGDPATSLRVSLSELQEASIPLEAYKCHIESVARDTTIKVYSHGGIIKGVLYGTPNFARIPNSRKFQEVFVGKLGRPLVPGDCGCWVRDSVTGKFFGQVIAGSPTSGLVMMIPARAMLEEILSSFPSTGTQDQTTIPQGDLDCPSKETSHLEGSILPIQTPKCQRTATPSPLHQAGALRCQTPPSTSTPQLSRGDEPQLPDRHVDCSSGEVVNQSLVEVHRRSGSTDTILNIFIAAGTYSYTYRRLIPILNAVCPEDILEKLYQGTGTPLDGPAVWLDDRDGTMEPRSYNGPMTISAFHKALRLKVCRRDLGSELEP